MPTPAPPQLWLHIGHGKTGSSFLQAALAGSGPALAAAGIDYPQTAEEARAARGMISSGNGAALCQFLDAAAGDFPLRPGPGRATLISSELLFSRLWTAEATCHLAEAARKSGFGGIRVLLFIRDPIGLCASQHQQSIKRGGGTATIEEAAKAFKVPRQVEESIAAWDAAPGVELTIRHYDRHRADLLAPFAAWLGISPGIFTLPPVEVVNRSLTAGELAFQRAINSVLGRSGEIAADALCELLPDIPADPVLPSLEAQDQLWERLAPSIARVNARAGPENAYRFDRTPPPQLETDRLSFTPAQIEVMGRAVGAEIARLRVRLKGSPAMIEAALAAQGDTPANQRLLLEMARQHAEQGRGPRARALLERLLGLVPGHREAQTLLARLRQS